MQQNGQEQQDQRPQQQATEQPEREGEPSSSTVSAQLEQRLTAEQQKAEECLDLLRRTQADFVNYRRRMGQDRRPRWHEVREGHARDRCSMILDERWKPLHQSWPRIHGCKACTWLREDSRRCSTNWACDRSAQPESRLIRAGMRPSRGRREQMCLKERSCTLHNQGMPWENVSFALLRLASQVLRLT